MRQYRPFCPKCKHSLWIEEYYYQQFQTGCSMCGFRLIGEEAIRAMLTDQKAAWELEQSEIKQAEEKKAREIELKSAEIIAHPQPTPAQRRRGAIHATECAYCRKHLFRRKKEVEAGNSFCSSAHQREWTKTKEAA